MLSRRLSREQPYATRTDPEARVASSNGGSVGQRWLAQRGLLLEPAAESGTESAASSALYGVGTSAGPVVIGVTHRNGVLAFVSHRCLARDRRSTIPSSGVSRRIDSSAASGVRASSCRRRTIPPSDAASAVSTPTHRHNRVSARQLHSARPAACACARDAAATRWWNCPDIGGPGAA